VFLVPSDVASGKGHVDATKALAALGASVNTPNNDGATPVYVAAAKGHVGAIKALAALGASVNTPANDGGTPVHAAAMGHVATIKLLYKLGVDLGWYTLSSGEKVSFLDVAEAAHQEAAVELIKSILEKIECDVRRSVTARVSVRLRTTRSTDLSVKRHWLLELPLPLTSPPPLPLWQQLVRLDKYFKYVLCTATVLLSDSKSVAAGCILFKSLRSVTIMYR